MEGLTTDVGFGFLCQCSPFEDICVPIFCSDASWHLSIALRKLHNIRTVIELNLSLRFQAFSLACVVTLGNFLGCGLNGQAHWPLSYTMTSLSTGLLRKNCEESRPVYGPAIGHLCRQAVAIRLCLLGSNVIRYYHLIIMNSGLQSA